MMKRVLGSGLMKNILAAAVLVAALRATPLPAATLSDIPTTATWVTNGIVDEIVCTSKTVYIAGEFTQVGPATGGFVPLSAATGLPAASFPKVAGTVYTCVADGIGGWYVGGWFSRVGTEPRSNIAHILADGRVDPAWNPKFNGGIDALAVSGGILFAGGGFTSIGTQEHLHLAALDATTGALKPWNLDVDRSVSTLEATSTTVYVAGSFSNIAGQWRYNLAALNAATGAVTAWNPSPNNWINSLAVSGNAILVGGDFTSIGGKTRNHLAALDATTGVATNWNPNANQYVSTLALSGSTLYVGGNFTSIGGQARNRLAALDITTVTTKVTGWNPNADQDVSELSIADGIIYARGYFTSVGGQPRNRLAALDAATGAVTAWDPNPNDYPNVLVAAGDTVYAGGRFTSFGGQARNRLAALDAITGEVTPWNPNANQYVSALALSGSTLYVGGNFTSIGGQARNRLAAVDADTGAVKAWNPDANQSVFDLAVGNGVVYAAGGFNTISGQARNELAALDPITGTATSWNPNPSNNVYSLAVSGQTVYAGGWFTTIGGQSSKNIAAIDATTGLATAWNPGASDMVFTLTASGNTVYAGGYFYTIGGQVRPNIAALDAATGAATAWNPTGVWGTEVRAIAVAGDTVYAGGGFNRIAGRTRNSLAALDVTSGMVKAWNPDPYHNLVCTLAASGESVYVGGQFTSIGGQPQSYLARFDPTSRPATPDSLGAVNIHSDRLTWTWADNSDDETGFKVWSEPGAAEPATLCATTSAGATAWSSRGLTPNTQYAFQVAATNALGDSSRSTLCTTFTLAPPPTAGQNLITSHPVNQVRPLGTVFGFTNPKDFGAGTHGGDAWMVSGFRYAWDTMTTHSFSGGEPLWNQGTLSFTPTRVDSYYLHLQSLNGAGTPTSSTLDLGPFVDYAPLTVVTQPVTRVVNPGSTVNFSVAAIGVEPFSYQWRRNKAPLADGARVGGATSSTLRLTDVTLADAGNIDCVVRNPEGTTTSLAARLIVNPTLTIISPYGYPSPSVGPHVVTTGTYMAPSVATPFLDGSGTSRVCTGWTATGAAPASGTNYFVPFTIDRPTTITWHWKTQYQLSATTQPQVPASGMVTLADGVTPAFSWYDAGARVTVRAMPEPGWRFGSWLGDLLGWQNPATLVMDKPRAVQARFIPDDTAVGNWSQYE